MKITKEHALFYASKKSKLFPCDVSIHTLINSQVHIERNVYEKYNDLAIVNSLYQRCKRNGLNLIAELRVLSWNSKGLRHHRARLCRKIIKKLLRGCR